MSYIDLPPDQRATFIALQMRGTRSPATIRELRKSYPGSPAADQAERLLQELTPAERAILESCWSARRKAAA